jgi:hypothetical protein
MSGGGSNARRWLERSVLLGPALVRRAAAARAVTPEERWMLLQGRPVRESYVSEVLEARGDTELRRQIWMMGQPDAVRASYVREILEPLVDVERAGRG